MTGRAFVYGDNIDTDMLAPGMYMKFAIEELARHCLEAVDPSFVGAVRPGDIVVGGDNFGMGSSREQAVMALRHHGVSVVVARSFAGLFFRNAVNLGLAPLVCQDVSGISPGDSLAADPEKGIVENLTRGTRIACEPIPAHLMAMLRDGGLIPHLEKKLKARAS